MVVPCPTHFAGRYHVVVPCPTHFGIPYLHDVSYSAVFMTSHTSTGSLHHKANLVGHFTQDRVPRRRAVEHLFNVY